MKALLFFGMPEVLCFVEGSRKSLLGLLAIALVFTISIFLDKRPPTPAERPAVGLPQ